MSSRNIADTRKTDGYSAIDPFTFDQKIPACDAWDALKDVLESRKRLVIDKSNDTHITAIERTPILRFKDDLSFELELENSLIHARSASRLGSYDFGVNHHRLEEIRKEWKKLLTRYEF